MQRVVPAEGLDAAVDAFITDLLASGPAAQAEIKQLYAQLSPGPVTAEVRELTAQTIARVRKTPEAPRRLCRLPGQAQAQLDTERMNLNDSRILVVGAGLMGAGIAQVAAQAGHQVSLFDARAGAAEAAKSKLSAMLDGLVTKGKLTADAVQATLARITPVEALGTADLVIEAIVENLEVKRALFAELEALLPAEAVIATNTSSISVTALARGMRKPERLVGMHFFNPVPLMKLVEVVSGLGTAPAVAQAVFELAGRWGKTAVHTRSTPGFIVNRIARPYYAETLMLLQDRAAAPELIDACLRAAGFRMGPCELMDLIGHDTNFAVTNSVFAANFFDRRFTPSLVQQELVDAGFFGRKSGRGFYRYPEGAPALPTVNIAPPRAARLVVHGRGALAERFVANLPEAVRELDSDWVGPGHRRPPAAPDRWPACA